MSILPLHDSVYRALTNPDLDRPISSTISTPLLNDSPPLANTTPISILSSSSQDNISAFSIVGGTSEDEEYATGHTTSFIMPRVQQQQSSDLSNRNLNINHHHQFSNIDIQIKGKDVEKLFNKLNLYARTLTHCNFHIHELDDCPTIDLNIFIAHSLDELIKLTQFDNYPFIPIIIGSKEQIGHHLKGAICKPIFIDSWSNKLEFMILIDFLSNLKSPSCISSSNDIGGDLPLNDVNSILIKSISFELEAKLLSLKEYQLPSSSSSSSSPFIPQFNIWVVVPFLTGIVCCCCYCIYKYII